MAYGSYTGTLQDLTTQQANAPGNMKLQGGGTAALAGTQAANLNNQIGSMETQRAVDPWGFYRGGAADELAATGGSANDPSNMFRSKLQQMVTGQFDSSDPSYQWRFQQGQQALERSQGSRGLLNSGNAAIELQNYGQNAASQEYQAQFQRLLQGMSGVESQYNTQQSRLMELAGIGNVGALNQRLGMQQNAMDNASYQQGIASSMNQPKDIYAGYSFG